jgi:hypothetical protein
MFDASDKGLKGAVAERDAADAASGLPAFLIIKEGPAMTVWGLAGTECLKRPLTLPHPSDAPSLSPEGRGKEASYSAFTMRRSWPSSSSVRR